MPIYSMTGFARVQARVQNRDQDQLSYTLTIKSVNHRFLDVQLRLPSGLDALEMEDVYKRQFWTCAPSIPMTGRPSPPLSARPAG